jgi:hypothetical protein
MTTERDTNTFFFSFCRKRWTVSVPPLTTPQPPPPQPPPPQPQPLTVLIHSHAVSDGRCQFHPRPLLNPTPTSHRFDSLSCRKRWTVPVPPPTTPQPPPPQPQLLSLEHSLTRVCKAVAKRFQQRTVHLRSTRVIDAGTTTMMRAVGARAHKDCG